MKKATFSIDKLWDYNLFLIAAFPLFPKGVQSSFMLLFFFLSIILFVKRKNFKVTKAEVAKVLLFSSVFLLYLIGVLYSKNSKEGFGFVVKTAPLLMFPLSIGILAKEKIDKRKIKIILTVYVASLVISLLSIHLYLGVSTSELSGWEYRLAFEKITNVHGTYFSIWIAFGVLILTSKVFNVSKVELLLLSLVIAYLIYWQLVIEARLPFVSTLVLVFSFLIHKIRNKKMKRYVIASVVIMSLCLLFFSHKNIFEKIDFSLPKGDYHLQHKTMTSEHIRGGIYYCSLKLIREQWLFGYGIGDVNDELKGCYKMEIDSNVYEIKHYNSHNQYIQMMLSSGVLGFLVFILGIIIAIRNAYQKQLEIYLTFSLLVTICFLTENILSRHDGVLFYGLFNSIFIFYSKNTYKSQ